MKIGDKEIRTGLELARNGVRAESMITRIERKVREMLIKKFGYILTAAEKNQIFRRETERGERSQEALARSQWNIMRSKERAMFRVRIIREIQEGKLFKKHERKEGLEEGIQPKNPRINMNHTVINY